MKISGNTILVTGGTSGIGRALAEALHDRGNEVIVAGRRQAELDAVTASRPGMAGFQLDLRDPAALPGLTREIAARFRALNVVIANAGISRDEDMKAEGWTTDAAEAIVQTNIVGVLRTVAAFLPLLKPRTDSAIIATSSNLAFIPRAEFPTYCASKAFLHSWLQSVRHQLRNIPIEVLELSPPYVATELTGSHQLADPRAVPLAAYIAEVMHLLEIGDHPRGEILVERDHARRTAERDGTYDELYARINPA